MLKSLENVYFAFDHEITVSTDCDDKDIIKELYAVVSIFNLNTYKRLPLIKAVLQPNDKGCPNRITHHYYHALSHMVNTQHKDSPYLIVFEDDLELGKDVLHYFYAHRELLEKENPENKQSKESSIWCISAWNDHGYIHTAQNETKSYRIDGWPGLGWMTKSALVRKELLPNWPLHAGADWDMWLRTDYTRNGRVCIVPDISRTYHFGESGKNVDQNWQELYFIRHKLYNPVLSKKANPVPKTLNFKPIIDLTKNVYDKNLEEVIKNGVRIDESTVCGDKVEFDFDSKTTYVLRIDEQVSQDENLKIFSCLRIWDLDIRGLYMGVLRIHYNRAPLIVLFCNINVRFCK